MINFRVDPKVSRDTKPSRAYFLPLIQNQVAGWRQAKQHSPDITLQLWLCNMDILYVVLLSVFDSTRLYYFMLYLCVHLSFSLEACQSCV